MMKFITEVGCHVSAIIMLPLTVIRVFTATCIKLNGWAVEIINSFSKFE